MSAAGARRAVTHLPIVDIGAFFGGSAADRARVGREIRQACVDIGFFYITGHGFGDDELKASLDWGHRFFALPLAQKMQVAVKPGSAMGFLQIGGLDPAANADKRPDRKERLFAARELLPGEPRDRSAPAGESQWPGEDVLPGFKDFVKAQIAKKVILAQTLSRAFALSLDLPENYFADYDRFISCMHGFNYYPPVDPAATEPQWGFSPHTDYGSFTILLQDDLGGLQARNSAGEWIDVPPIPGTFVVNLGDLMARWTNDLYVSTLHRALNRSPVPRLSLPFFVYPDRNAVIRCIETCQSPANPARYAPVVAGEYVYGLLAKAYSTGRVGISERTAARIEA